MMTSLARRCVELRRPLFIATAIALATYLYLMMNFPTGNHDWDRMNGINVISYQVALGRWFTPASFALSSFRMLPVLNAALGIMGYIAAGFVTTYLVETCLRSRLSGFTHAGCALLLALVPFSSWTFFFSYQSAVGPIAQLLCVLGLLTVIHQATWPRALGGAVLFCLSMATYQATLNTAAVIFWFVTICSLLDSQVTRRESWRRIFVLAASITLGAVLYKLSLTIMSAFDLLASTYHFKFLSLNDLPARAIELAGIAVHHLIVAQPFFPAALKLLLLVITLVGVAQLLLIAVGERSTAQQAIVRIAIVIVGFGLMIYSTKIQFLVSDQDTFYRNRFAAFGVSFVYLPFIAAAGLVTIRVRQLLYRGTLGLAIWGCVIQDLEWQDGWVKQNEYDKRVLNRVIARIEQLPGFTYEKKFTLIQAGNLPNIRKEYFPYVGPDSPTNHYTLMAPWAPKNAYEVIEPRFRLTGESRTLSKLKKEEKNDRQERIVKRMEGARPWPHKSSVQLIDEYILVVLSKAGPNEPKRSHKKRSADPT